MFYDDDDDATFRKEKQTCIPLSQAGTLVLMAITEPTNNLSARIYREESERHRR